MDLFPFEGSKAGLSCDRCSGSPEYNDWTAVSFATLLFQENTASLPGERVVKLHTLHAPFFCEFDSHYNFANIFPHEYISADT